MLEFANKRDLENIEEIAAMDGADGIFVGPFDLSISLGIPGQIDSPPLPCNSPGCTYNFGIGALSPHNIP